MIETLHALFAQLLLVIVPRPLRWQQDDFAGEALLSRVVMSFTLGHG